jgi:hypothetical protein
MCSPSLAPIAALDGVIDRVLHRDRDEGLVVLRHFDASRPADQCFGLGQRCAKFFTDLPDPHQGGRTMKAADAHAHRMHGAGAEQVHQLVAERLDAQAAAHLLRRDR